MRDFYNSETGYKLVDVGHCESMVKAGGDINSADMESAVISIAESAETALSGIITGKMTGSPPEYKIVCYRI